MPELTPSNFYANVLQGQQQGFQRGQRSKLASLYQQSMTAPEDQRPSLLAQMAGIDPNAAYAQQKFYDQRTQNDHAQLVDAAKLLIGAPEAYRPQVYQQVRQKLGGAYGGNALPDQYDDTVAQAAQALVTAYGGGTASQPYTLAPGAKRFDANNKVVAEVPFSPQRPTWDSERGLWVAPPQSQPPQQPLTGTDSDGMQYSIDPNLPPEAQAMSRADAANGGASDNYTIRGGGQGTAIPVPGIGPKPKPPTDLERRIALARQMGATDDQIKGMVIGASNAAGAASEDYSLSQDAISNSAWDYILTGTRPPSFGGKEGLRQRTAIQNEVAKIAKNAGVSVSELVTQKGKYKALQTSMSNLQKQSDMMDKANETFHRNADLMLSLSSQVPRFDSALLNKYLLDYNQQWKGDPATAAYIAAARTAINEYAKIAAGATGSAGSTDTARREAEEAIRAAQNPQQLAQVIDTLKQDAKNQSDATHAQLLDIGSRMQQFGSGEQQPASSQKIPAVGTTQDGYRFRGGNPADPNSWEKL